MRSILLISICLLGGMITHAQDTLKVRYIKAGIAVPTTAVPIRIVPTVVVQRVFSAKNWLSYGISDFMLERFSMPGTADINLTQVFAFRLQYDRYLWSGKRLGVYVLGAAGAREIWVDSRPGTTGRFRTQFFSAGSLLHTGAGIRWCQGRWLLEAELPVAWLATDVSVATTENPGIPVRLRRNTSWGLASYFEPVPRLGVGFRLAP